MNLPDVIGWELSRALDQCDYLGIDIRVEITQPPAQKLLDDEIDEEMLRVVCVRPLNIDCALLIVCPEHW